MNDSTPPPQPAPARSGGSALLLVFWLALGLGLRWAHLQGLGDTVFEWEADGFVLGWEGWAWGDWNRMRPPGFGALLFALVEALGLSSIQALRGLCVALSLGGLLAAWELARVLSQRTGLKRRSLLAAGTWVTCLWALHPALIRSSVSPTPELLLAPALCLMLARLIACGDGPFAWALATGMAAGAFALGGVTLLAATLVGLVVYLLPVPPLPAALRVIVLLGVAGAGFFVLQRGPDASRVWVPDMAPTYSALALLETPPPHPNDVPTQADRAAVQRLTLLRRALPSADGVTTSLAFGRRLRDDLLGPTRLAPLGSGLPAPPPPQALAALGWFDVFLRGGSLLFACAVVGLMKRRGSSASSLPRAGLVLAVLAFVVLQVFAAVGPLALVPVDLLLLGVAAGGVAGTAAGQAWTRRVAFAVGGVLLCSFLYTAGQRQLPLSDWIGTLGPPHQNQGAQLVELLDTPNPGDWHAELRIAQLLLQADTPLLRFPEAALAHAMQATRLQPTLDTTLQMLVRAQVENAQYRDAARLAEAGMELHPAGGFDHKAMELLLQWVRQEQRMGQGLPPARPH
ncbi:MAG: hypothetical protein DRQ55_15220 [Planctomycetota bacterium]|nr:MAG: hypothetical protein DRQ55_15220 [Planctomycetota bacterium]